MEGKRTKSREQKENCLCESCLWCEAHPILCIKCLAEPITLAHLLQITFEHYVSIEEPARVPSSSPVNHWNRSFTQRVFTVAIRGPNSLHKIGVVTGYAGSADLTSPDHEAVSLDILSPYELAHEPRDTQNTHKRQISRFQGISTLQKTRVSISLFTHCLCRRRCVWCLDYTISCGLGKKSTVFKISWYLTSRANINVCQGRGISDEAWSSKIYLINTQMGRWVQRYEQVDTVQCTYTQAHESTTGIDWNSQYHDATYVTTMHHKV